VDGICELLKSLASPLYANLSKYEDMMKQNNICGRVLTSCDLMELKQVLINSVVLCNSNGNDFPTGY